MANYNCKAILDDVGLRSKVSRELKCGFSDFRVDQTIWEMIKGYSDVLDGAEDDKTAILMLSMRVGMKPPDKDVLAFITAFRAHTPGAEELLIKHFVSGYCWHFAHILMETFKAGAVCWCAPYSHFVWLYNDVAYDIRGVSLTSAEHYIPEEYLGEALTDFIHKPGQRFDATEEDIQRIINAYLEGTQEEGRADVSDGLSPAIKQALDSWRAGTEVTQIFEMHEKVCATPTPDKLIISHAGASYVYVKPGSTPTEIAKIADKLNKGEMVDGAGWKRIL